MSHEEVPIEPDSEGDELRIEGKDDELLVEEEIELEFHYVLCTVLRNAAGMVGDVTAFNAGLNWRRYPAVWVCRLSSEVRHEPGQEDVVASLKSMDLFIDVDDRNLLRLSVAIRLRVPQEMDNSNQSSQLVGIGN